MGYEIFFQEYHGMADYPEFKAGGAEVEKIWDAYAEGEALDMVFHPTDAKLQELIQAKINLASSRKAIPPSTVLYEPKPIDHLMNVWLIRIEKLDTFREYIRDWLFSTVIPLEAHRGADDGTYDYYPDVWVAARQICFALNMLEVYANARQRLLDTTIYGQDDELRSLIPA